MARYIFQIYTDRLWVIVTFTARCEVDTTFRRFGAGNHQREATSWFNFSGWIRPRYGLPDSTAPSRLKLPFDCRLIGQERSQSYRYRWLQLIPHAKVKPCVRERYGGVNAFARYRSFRSRTSDAF